MPITVDLSELHSMTEAAVRQLGDVGATMKHVLDDATAEERHTHAYNNITHRLEGSTFALGPYGSGDTVSVEAGARMEYASEVEGRGRSNITEILEKAGDDIDARFNTEASTVGR